MDVPTAPAAAPKKRGLLKKILIALALLVAALAGLIAIQPSDYRVSRTAAIAAPPAAVFAQVNDFHAWEAWSPWAKLDPDAQLTYEGPSAGEGAIVRWAGNDDVGEGNMTILESRPAELIRIRLEFIKPFPGVSSTEFGFKAEGAGTTVTWTMTGTNNFIGKAFCLFMDMDKMVGGDFEKGLANINSVVESGGQGQKK